MSNGEDKFFADLANFGANNEPEEEGFELELAKASAVNVPVKHTRKPVVQADPEPEEVEDYSGEPEGQLTIDVYQTPNDIVIESAIAGVRPEDIDINVTSDSITVRGERRREHTVRDEDYFYQECYWGRFSRSVILPQEVDPDNASVNFKNGVLTVKLPKLNRKKTRKLRVRVE